MEAGISRAPFGPAGSAPVDGDLCRRLLGVALSRGGDLADVFFEYRAAGGITFEEGITRTTSSSVRLGAGVRVLSGDATGYAYVEDLTWESLSRAAETAGRIARAGRPQEPSRLRPQTLPRRYELGGPIVVTPDPERRGLLERASRAALGADPRISKAHATLHQELREILVATSDGRLCHDVQPLTRFQVRVVAEQQGRRESGRSGGGGRVTLGYFETRSPEWHGHEAARQALVNLDAQPAPAGQMPVVLAPGDSGIFLHEAVGHGLEADFNRRGTSNYTGRVGDLVASDLCTVVDDPSLLQGRGSLNVDDEGVESQRSTLIEGGVLRGYLHDQLSARHFGTASSGNGRRESYRNPPLPRMTNTVLLAGPHSPEEIISSVDRGVYARAFGGGQVDISNGDFVFSLTEAYLIEKGRISTPLRGVNLIGNGPETLSLVSMLGHDLHVSDGIWTCGKDGQSVPVGVGCPTTKISRITVGGTLLD